MRHGSNPPAPAQRKPPPPPNPPPARLINEWSGVFCPKCGSTMMRKRFLIAGARHGCIQPECGNYGGK